MHAIANGCPRWSGRFVLVLLLSLAVLPTGAAAQTASVGLPRIQVVDDESGSRLRVDGEDFMVFGMNWGYIPIGENYLYSLWEQPDAFIEAALAREMPLLQAMGINVIRQYAGIPPRWVEYIYETYGIFTVLNHPVARYGYTLDGVWHPSVDYSDPDLRAAVIAEVGALVDEFRDTPGVLMWLLGNENNYGLSWSSFEIEALPKGERDAARARYLYSLFGEIIRDVKQRDPHRPVAIANGDLQYIDLIAAECEGLDVFGSNVYRGISARDFFAVVDEKLGVPAMFTEFGADAFNAREMREDQLTQARYLLGQWQEIYEQSAGKGRVGNAIGGIIFQWSDGWWKFGQDSRLEVHDTNASWPNDGYPEDYVAGDNNMNEEWWGIAAKGRTDHNGFYELYPRAAYYALRDAFRLDPYGPQTDLVSIRAHFAAIEPAAAVSEARGDQAALTAESVRKVRVSGLRLEFSTFSTGGENISTPPAESPQQSLPAYRGFDSMQSFYVDFEAHPTEAVAGRLSLNVLGRVAKNPIDEIFYENRGYRGALTDDNGDLVDLEALQRVKVYQAEVSWDDRWFKLDGFYRTGHTHWGYEGDFFGIYRDAYYGANVDIYNGEAPVGFEMAFKKSLDGLKIAFGPQLWWGANPSLILKYRRQLGAFDTTALYQDEFSQNTQVTSSVAVPLPKTRRASLHVATTVGGFDVELGGIWSGSTKEGEAFQILDETNRETPVLADEIKARDAFGGKAKISYQHNRWNWYAQGAYMGLVADGGPTAAITYTGWLLKDSGSNNQANFMTGVAYNAGTLQIAPNFLWQKPIVGPIPGDAPPPARPRNVLDDPFAVRWNRETVGGEILLTYDPTPATWMWAWDNDVREDARLAWSLGYVFRHLPTTMDAAIGLLEDGRTTFAFPGATPPRDLWQIHARVVSRVSADTRLVGHLYFGPAEPNGDDPRSIDRFGADLRVAWPRVSLATAIRVNDWGPYDYHRDFNFTYPLQLIGDAAYTLGKPQWYGLPHTKLGIRLTYRSLDRYSNRYQPEGVPEPPTDELYPDGLPGGREWEIRTYLHMQVW